MPKSSAQKAPRTPRGAAESIPDTSAGSDESVDSGESSLDDELTEYDDPLEAAFPGFSEMSYDAADAEEAFPDVAAAPAVQSASRPGVEEGAHAPMPPQRNKTGARPTTRRRLNKSAGGAVRPWGTRRSLSGRVRLTQAKSLSIAAALVASATDPNFSEFEEILSRMVDRIVKLLQADKCVFLLHDNVRAELQAVSPARGFPGDHLSRLSCPVRGKGLSAWVFRHGESAILDPETIEADPRAQADRLTSNYDVRSSLSVPLFIEHRDERNTVVRREAIGVAHVFNKHTDFGRFSAEDQALLEAMSRSAASIFNSAKAFREVVTEKQELIQTLDSLYVGLMMVGLDGRIIQINPAARGVLGIGEDDSVVGLRYEAVTENASFRAVVDRALAGLDPIEVTGEVTVKSGTEERIYQAHCAPVKNAEQNSVVGLLILMSDITEIRGVDRMKTAFISTVSHELRTPLTSIKGFIATLLDYPDGFSRDEQREFYEIINGDCDRLTRLIDDLLNVSRIEQGRTMQLNLSQVDIPAIVTKVLTVQRAYTSPDKHHLTMDFPTDFPIIEADADKIDQILTNLVNNAIKYSPQGGPILVTGGPIEDADEIYISVCDQGMGIPREHIKKVFERFHRVDNRDNREIGGTGIGLFLVKALAEAHHGSARVESELGRGSVFTVTLPVRQPAAEPAPAA